MGQSQSVPELSKVSSCQSARSLDSSVCRSVKRSCNGDGLPISFPYDLIDCRNGKVNVKSVGIYVEPLQSKQSWRLDATPFTHHLLIIDVDCVEMPNGGERKLGYIMAEKGLEGNNGRITVQCMNTLRGSSKRVCRLADCGTIPMQKVLDILQKPSADYSFCTENCWKYADQTFRWLIEEFSEGAEPGSVTKERLQSYLKDLPKIRMPGDAFNLSPAEALTCSALPVGAGGGYLGYIARVAFVARLAAKTVLPALGHTLHTGPVGLQVSHTFAAAIMKGGATLIPIARGAAVTHWQINLCAAAIAIGSPQVLLTVLAIVGGGIAGLVIAWLVYKLIRGVWTGVKDDMTWFEFVRYIFKGLWQCLCFGLKWVRNSIVTLFKWFFESIDSWFIGSGSRYGHTV